MVQQRGEGAEPVVMLGSQLIQLTQRKWSPLQTLESIDSRVGDRGFWLQAGRAAMVFSCGKADEGGFWVGPGRRGKERMVRLERPSEGVLGKDWRRTAEQRGESAILIDIWKRRLARARTFPEAEAAIPGGQTGELR
jgi:hypothetical protein